MEGKKGLGGNEVRRYEGNGEGEKMEEGERSGGKEEEMVRGKRDRRGMKEMEEEKDFGGMEGEVIRGKRQREEEGGRGDRGNLRKWKEGKDRSIIKEIKGDRKNGRKKRKEEMKEEKIEEEGKEVGEEKTEGDEYIEIGKKERDKHTEYDEIKETGVGDNISKEMGGKETE